MKIFKFTILFSLYAAFLSGCSGASLIGADASASETLKTLSVMALHHALDETSGAIALEEVAGAKTFVNDAGVTVTLESAYVSWGHLFLISGGDDADCEPDHDVEIHLETIEDILAADLSAVELAATAIEDRAYCRYELELTPDNADTDGIDSSPEIAGRTVYVAGIWADGSRSGAFELAVDGEIQMAADFERLEDGVSVVHPLHFHDGEDAASVTFSNIYSSWFNGMTFSESADEAAALFEANVTASLSQWLEAE